MLTPQNVSFRVRLFASVYPDKKIDRDTAARAKVNSRYMTTATHQALLCGELYHLICENCDIQTLSALSRTSRDLQETALDALWSEIPNLGPLVRCMPCDLWEQRNAHL
jgi:hypothetical protein